MRRFESTIDLALVTAMMMAVCTPAEGSGTPTGFTGVTHLPAVSTPHPLPRLILPGCLSG